MEVYYFNSNPKHFGINTKLNKKFFGHQIYEDEKTLFVTPVQIDKKNISPHKFSQLKKKHKFKNIVMFDRIKGVDKNILISDHINRSGFYPLIENTPYKNLPMFPDMSGVYMKHNICFI